MIKRTKNTSIAETPQMLCIKTDKGCFISDCLSTSGYDYNCHRTDIVDLIFNGKKATETYCKNWYYIEVFVREATNDIIEDVIEKNIKDIFAKKIAEMI